MWLKWTGFCLGKRRTGTGFSLRGRRKKEKEKARGREKSAKKRENPLSPIPLFFPFLPIPYPFRRLTGLGYAIRFEAHDKSGMGGGGLLLGIFGGAQTKKKSFSTPVSRPFTKTEITSSLLTLESQQKDFLKSISNSHISLPILFIWNWNDTTLLHSCSSIKYHNRFQTKVDKALACVASVSVRSS